MVQLVQQDRLDEAIALCRRLVNEHPQLGPAAHLLGILLARSGDGSAAEQSLRNAVRLEPANAAAWNDLGNVCSEQKRPDDARAAYRRAIEIRPDYVDAWQNLGWLCQRSGRYEEAAEAFQQVVQFDPARSQAHRDLCAAWRAAGHIDEARAALIRWLQHEPDHPVANHLLAAWSGLQAIPARASDQYVRNVFDQFADRFEAELADLQYHGPELIAAALAQHVGTPRGDLQVLDAGCGTGLCGTVLRPYARRLTGVDLSPQMLRHAQQKRIFDDLQQAELTSYLETHPETWDLIVVCDTLNYFGELDPVFTAASRALQTSGRLVFTLEYLPDQNDAPGFVLHPSGRYGHRTAYVCQSLAAANLCVLALDTVTLRNEAGQPVPGLLCVAQRPPANHTAGT